MNESELRRQIESVRRGTLPRRRFVERLAACGIGAPMAWLLLADAGVAQPSSAPPYKPTKRGGGGPLRVLLWQAPTLLNPHFATGTKDELGAQVFYEPLARLRRRRRAWSPILAAEIPTPRERRRRAPTGARSSGSSRRGVTWHDGTPFTADDVVFNWQFATDPATAATVTHRRLQRHAGSRSVDVAHACASSSTRPTPFWPSRYSQRAAC